MSTAKDLICVGAFAGAHGVRGETKVKCFTEDPSDICNYGTLYSEDGKQAFELSYVRADKLGAVCRVKDINDRDIVHKLKGTRLYVPREALPDIEEDDEEFYYVDLVGLKVLDEDKNEIGTISSVQDFGAGDLLEVNPSEQDGESEPSFFIPFTLEVVPEVNVKGGYVIFAREELLSTADDDLENFIAEMDQEEPTKQ